MNVVTLVYPHQLFENHPAVREGQCVFLIEDPLYFGGDPHWPLAVHKWRLVLHRASMQAWARARAHVCCVEAPAAGVDSVELLQQIVPDDVQQIECVDPCDDILLRRLQRFAKNRGIELVIHASPNFLTPADFLNQYTGSSRKRPFMADFYKAQRTRMGILVEPNGSPLGGKWSFDDENRRRFDDHQPVPPDPRVAANDDVRAAQAYVEKRYAHHPGRVADFHYPVNRDDALRWLDQFLDQRLEDFGAYEDALSRQHRVLFHSLLTPMLNIGLLNPQEIIDRALQRLDRVPLNSMEGFVRQIIGWREFMAGIYRHRGAAIRRRNFWNHTRPLPRAFYTASTGLPPVDEAIRRALDCGYCHHIERLMVLGNIMVLCRIDPDEVYRWFMEMFIDAYDWVMVPNVYGMSQFADGGTFTTKPYISGSNYIRKMSHYPKGPWCDTWDGLFWSFIADHQDFFAGNPRLSMMARQWQKMPTAKQAAHRACADAFLDQLDRA